MDDNFVSDSANIADSSDSDSVDVSALEGANASDEGSSASDSFISDGESASEFAALYSENSETVESVGCTYNEETFFARLDSIENLMLVQIIGLALIAGCLMATLVVRFFHVR